MRAGTLVNGAFMAGSVVNGVKTGKKVAENPNSNKYDKALKNPTFEGFNKEHDPVVKNACDIIDDLYNEKTAADNEKNNSKDDKNTMSKAIGATIAGAAIGQAIVKKNPLAPFRSVGKGVKNFGYEYPKLLLNKFRGGKVTLKAVKGAIRTAGGKEKKVKPSEVNDKFVNALGWGAGAGVGNLAVHMLGDKYFNKDGKNNKKVYNSFKTAIPDPVTQAYHKYNDEINKNKSTHYKAYKRPDRYSVDNRRKHSTGYYSNHDRKKYDGNRKEASDMLEQLYMEKKAGVNTGSIKNTAKKLFHEDVLQNSIKSLPYYLMPLGVGMAVNKDLRSDGRPMRGKNAKPNQIVIEVPTSSLNKTASAASEAGAKIFNAKDSWKQFAREGIPSSIAKSLTWAAPITALTAITGRNLRGAGEKMNGKLDDGKTRIIIETNPAHRNKDNTFVNASEELDSMYKEASEKKKNRNSSLNARAREYMKFKGLSNMANNHTLETIVRAAKQGSTVNITYRDSKGVITSRETEPYDIKNDKYWGYDVNKNSIRQFSLDKVSAATITGNRYNPRWPVNI